MVDHLDDDDQSLSSSFSEKSPIPNEMVVVADLLFTLRRSSAPLLLYNKIRSWLKKSLNIEIPTRSNVIKYFMLRYDLQKLWPKRKAVYLPGKRKKSLMVIHDAEAALKSLFANPVLMQQKNLNIDLRDPHKAPSVTDKLDDVVSGSVYQMGWQRYCSDGEKKVPAFVTPFLDSSPLDMHGHISLEPCPVTSTIFKEEVRRRPEAWVPLFYVPNRNTMAVESDVNVQQLQGGDAIIAQPNINVNLQDYHSVLSTGFDSLKEVHNSGGLSIKLPRPSESDNDGVIVNTEHSHSDINGTKFSLQVPIQNVIGDAQGNDKLCCLKGGFTNPQCRYCYCPFDQMGNPDAEYQRTKMATIERWCREKPDAARNRGYYPLSRNAFFDMPFCDQEGGVHACTPAGFLHQLQHGVIEYACLGFFNLKSVGSIQSVFTNQSIKVAEKKMRQIGFFLQRQSDRSLGRTYFRTGYIPKKAKGSNQRKSMKRNGQEMTGVVIVLVLFLLSNETETKNVRDRVGGVKTKRYIHVFDHLLLLLEFLKQSSMRKISIARLHAFMPLFFQYFISTLEREEGAGNNLRKFHYLLHLALDILRLGPPINYVETVPERNFKHVKQLARRTQKRAHTVDYQCACHDVEARVLDRAFAEITFARTNEWHFFWGYEEASKQPPKEGPSNPFLNVKFDWDPMDGRVSVSMQPTRFRRDLLQQKWTSTDISLPDLQSFLKKEIAPTVVRDDYSCSIRTSFNKDGVRYKANPLFQNGGAWHDWAYFETEKIGKTLCHIMCLVEINGTLDNAQSATMLSNDGRFVDGLYAMCHYFPEDPFTDDRQCSIYGNEDDDYVVDANSNVVRWSCKVTPHIHLGRLVRHKPKPTVALVPMKDLLGPAIVIPENDPNYPHTYMCIATKSEWPQLFEKMMAVHVSEDRAQRTLADLIAAANWLDGEDQEMNDIGSDDEEDSSLDDEEDSSVDEESS